MIIAFVLAWVAHRRITALERFVTPLLYVSFLWQAIAIFGRPLDATFPHEIDAIEIMFGVGLVLAGACFVGVTRGVRYSFAGALVVFLLVAGHAIAARPSPPIDVWMFQQDAAAALLRGVNPYAIDFPNIYPDASLYGEGLVKDGRLQFGFPYPPLSLLLVTPAYALTGDVRYGHLAALVAGVALIARALPKSRPLLLLFLFTPRAFYLLSRGWTEPLVVLGMGAALLNRWALGLVFGVKQYAALVAPLLP